MDDGLRDIMRYSGNATESDNPSALELTLHITDTELCAELAEYDEGRERHEFAVNALKIGILALRHAKGRIDIDQIRDEGDRLLGSLGLALAEHQRGLTQQLTANMKEYFDPESGRFNERIERLIKRDGELEQILRQQIGGDGSELVRTLANHLGEQSPLMRILDPQASDGLLPNISNTVTGTLCEQREKILQEFSLDNKEGALSRLVAELAEHHAQTSGSLAEKIQNVVSEFSLDREDSALSRLVRRVEVAQKQISNEFSLDEENSALARMRRELLEVIGALRQENDQFQRDVIQKLTEATARKAESLRSTRHGHDFEDAVFVEIEAACQSAGDIANRTGNTTGLIKHCKKGDVVVELGREHAAAGACIVIEAKEQASFTIKDALAEIEEARKNRGSEVGLVVMSFRTAAQGMAPLTRHGNDIIVLWDSDDPATDLVLTAGLSVAKALCTRTKAKRDCEKADFEAIDRAVRNIEKRAEDLEQISTWAGTIKSNGDKIMNKVGSMRTELSMQIGMLDALIGDVRQLIET